MSDDVMSDDDPFLGETTTGPSVVELTLPVAAGGCRLDKALAIAVDASLDAPAGLSRSRLRGLIEAGAVEIDGARAANPSEKARAGALVRLEIPAPAPARPEPEAIPLAVVYEDADLIVVDKPAGMAVHPAPGSPNGTLVNALLAHCGETLSGVGGEIRPGVVHRIDKETSGLLVVAKTDAAHQGLARQFAAHDLERAYLALCWGAPDRADPRLSGLPAVTFEDGWIRIDAPIARHRSDRKRMAVASQGGRRAVTWARTQERFEVAVARGASAIAALIECRLETGRTHQIRVHLSHVGHPLVGDPVYGRPRKLAEAFEALGAALRAFPRQALHAGVLGFEHPIDGRPLRFERPPPEDFRLLVDRVRLKTSEISASISRR